MKSKPIAVWALPLAVLVAAALAILADPFGIAARLRGLEFDSYQSLQPRPYQDTAASGFTVRTLDIDAASIARFGPWPWSRLALARLGDELKAGGASVVVFDLPLNEPDLSSHLADLLPPGDPSRATLANFPAPDQRFAQSLGGMKAVTGFVLGERGGRTPSPKAALNYDGDSNALDAVPNFSQSAGALEPIEAASAGSGALNIVADSDGKFRRMPLVLRLDGKLVPSLDAEAMRLAAGEPMTLTSEEIGIAGINATSAIAGAMAGKWNVPLLADGSLAIYFSKDAAARHLSAAALDEGTIAPGALDHAIVFIAPPDAIVSTPLGARNIADVHAQAMEDVLTGAALKEPGGRYPGTVFLLVIGIALVVLFARANAALAGALALAGIVGVQAFTWFLFSRQHILLDSMNPSVALALVFAAGFSARRWRIAEARAHFRRVFAGTLGDAAIEQISRKPQLLRLEGESRTVTCLSCGIRRYARLSESFADDAPGFAKLIGGALAPLIQEALDSGGALGHFDGESFTAYWNAPLDDTDHAIHACDAANRMTVALAQTNETLAQERRFDGTAFEAIEVGIGISTGRAVAGGFGAKGAYAVTGDCMVLAESIRTLSSQYGPAVIVSEDTRKAAERGYAFLEVDYIATGARDEAVKLYALLGNPLVRASPKFRALQTFHDHIFQSLRTQQWDKARGLIEQCRKLSGASQKLYDLHLARIDYFEHNPPGADWDGAFRQILK
ncbi:MAG TPA: adenylate/guanylate cyclase domain-containing protein [Rhizomicrobium sp.]|nr:adenylate/guanylate cyclase domain-containing protein [Rhizomicrobium sp.]